MPNVLKLYRHSLGEATITCGEMRRMIVVRVQSNTKEVVGKDERRTKTDQYGSELSTEC
jgi:hypothetical protein